VGLTGNPVTGRKLKVNRTGDPGSVVSENDRYTLSLGEVIATANSSGAGGTPDFNIAPTGTATESTVGPGVAANGNNGIFTDFTHTTTADNNATWTLNLGTRKKINGVTLHNRTSCCGSRLRDITVTVRDSDNTVLYVSPLLNPENQGYAFPNGPATLSLDFNALVGGALVGQFVEVRRTPDPDLSGTASQGNTDEANVLSLGEVVVSGNDFTSYMQLLSNDLKTPMYNVNTSAFVRWPFSVTDGTSFTSLKLRVRYDDGFIAYLDGVKIAERNAPVSPVWNSAATGGDRVDTLATRFEDIDLAANIPQLTTGPHVLAIQGLTSAANDPDFLLQAQLFASSQTIGTALSYLEFPTPGAHNFRQGISISWTIRISPSSAAFTRPRNQWRSPATPSGRRFTTRRTVPSRRRRTARSTRGQSTSRRPRCCARAPSRRAGGPQTWTRIRICFSPMCSDSSPPARRPPNWPASPVGSQLLNYGMDPNVRTLYGDPAMIAALTQVPTISVVTHAGESHGPDDGHLRECGVARRGLGTAREHRVARPREARGAAGGIPGKLRPPHPRRRKPQPGFCEAQLPRVFPRQLRGLEARLPDLRRPRHERARHHRSREQSELFVGAYRQRAAVRDDAARSVCAGDARRHGLARLPQPLLSPLSQRHLLGPVLFRRAPDRGLRRGLLRRQQGRLRRGEMRQPRHPAQLHRRSHRRLSRHAPGRRRGRMEGPLEQGTRLCDRARRDANRQPRSHCVFRDARQKCRRHAQRRAAAPRG
jgi:hypothetical protein